MTSDRKSASRLDRYIESSVVEAPDPDDVPIPKRMHVEITNSCNLKCIMCYSPHMKRRKRFMTEDEFRRVAMEAARIGVEEMGLFTTGEAFLHPRTISFIRIAKQEANIPYVYITSNGILLTPEKADEVLEAGLDSLNLSIDGASKETYEAIRLGGSFATLIEHVQYISKRRNELNSPMRLGLTCVVQKTNRDELHEFGEVFGPYVDEIVMAPLSNQAGQMVDQFADLMADDLDTLYKRAEATDMDNPCSLLWKQLNVAVDGTLTACCIDYELQMKYGALDDGIEAAWNNPAMVEMRRNMLNKNYDALPMCKDCDMYRYDWTSLVSEMQSVPEDAGN